MKELRFLADVDINEKHELGRGHTLDIIYEDEKGYYFQLMDDVIIAPKEEEGKVYEVIAND